jgi:hypothetical protein
VSSAAASRGPFEFALAAFAQGLRGQGFIEDRNLSIEYIWADGHYDLLPSMAAEFVRRRMTVIVTFQGTVTAEAAKSRNLYHSDRVSDRDRPGRGGSRRSAQRARNILKPLMLTPS